ncbi:hypothetical protein PFISCL1PPCAC_15698, partial [Pristionchus fissidentatus]
QSFDLASFINPTVVPPFTHLHHNNNFFILGSIEERVGVDVVSRKFCIACRAPLPSSNTPNSVLFHLEKVRRNLGGQEIVRTVMGILHASRRCLMSRYPYAHKELLVVSQQFLSKHSEEDAKFICDEFGCNIQEIGVAIRH